MCVCVPASTWWFRLIFKKPYFYKIFTCCTHVPDGAPRHPHVAKCGHMLACDVSSTHVVDPSSPAGPARTDELADGINDNCMLAGRPTKPKTAQIVLYWVMLLARSRAIRLLVDVRTSCGAWSGRLPFTWVRTMVSCCRTHGKPSGSQQCIASTRYLSIRMPAARCPRRRHHRRRP